MDTIFDFSDFKVNKEFKLKEPEEESVFFNDEELTFNKLVQRDEAWVKRLLEDSEVSNYGL